MEIKGQSLALSVATPKTTKFAKQSELARGEIHVLISLKKISTARVVPFPNRVSSPLGLEEKNSYAAIGNKQGRKQMFSSYYDVEVRFPESNSPIQVHVLEGTSEESILTYAHLKQELERTEWLDWFYRFINGGGHFTRRLRKNKEKFASLMMDSTISHLIGEIALRRDEIEAQVKRGYTKPKKGLLETIEDIIPKLAFLPHHTRDITDNILIFAALDLKKNLPDNREWLTTAIIDTAIDDFEEYATEAIEGLAFIMGGHLAKVVIAQTFDLVIAFWAEATDYDEIAPTSDLTVEPTVAGALPLALCEGTFRALNGEKTRHHLALTTITISEIAERATVIDTVKRQLPDLCARVVGVVADRAMLTERPFESPISIEAVELLEATGRINRHKDLLDLNEALAICANIVIDFDRATRHAAGIEYPLAPVPMMLVTPIYDPLNRLGRVEFRFGGWVQFCTDDDLEVVYVPRRWKRFQTKDPLLSTILNYACRSAGMTTTVETLLRIAYDQSELARKLAGKDTRKRLYKKLDRVFAQLDALGIEFNLDTKGDRLSHRVTFTAVENIDNPKLIRERLGLTREELADRLHISPSYLTKIENEVRPLTPSLKTDLTRLATRLEVVPKIVPKSQTNKIDKAAIWQTSQRIDPDNKPP